MTNLIVYLLIGLLVGWLAGVLMRGRGFGVLIDILVGIIGAMIGGFVFDLLGLSPDSRFGSFITALVGAIIFLAIIGSIKKK